MSLPEIMTKRNEASIYGMPSSIEKGRQGLSLSRGEDFRLTIVRATACILVVSVHVVTPHFLTFVNGWWLVNAVETVGRNSVYLFLMIAGAIMLRRDEPLDVFLRKRYFKILPPLLIWSYIYLVWYKVSGAAFPGWISPFLGPVVYPFWYFYVIIGLYLFVPMLRKMYKGSSESEKRYFLILWFLLGTVYPVARVYFGLSWDMIDAYHLFSFMGLAGYLFLGAYLYDLGEKGLSGKMMLLAAALAVGGNFMTWFMTMVHSGQLGRPDMLFYEHNAPFFVIATAGVFLFCMGLKTTRASRAGKVMGTISDCSLGIYCIHPFVLSGVKLVFGLTYMAGNPLWTVPCTAAVTLFFSYIAVYLMRKIPVMRYIA
jgi:surface polysaccharide O-acyltransferase-like enzyme